MTKQAVRFIILTMSFIPRLGFTICFFITGFFIEVSTWAFSEGKYTLKDSTGFIILKGVWFHEIVFFNKLKGRKND